jgi:hypothetical protein
MEGSGNMSADHPMRIQLSRRKGWRMPPNTVKVCRPGKWGNPFRVGPDRDPDEAVNAFEWWLREQGGQALLRDIGELRGRNLACWCPLDAPCHADVLLRLANAVGANPEPVCADCGRDLPADGYCQCASA